MNDAQMYDASLTLDPDAHICMMHVSLMRLKACMYDAYILDLDACIYDAGLFRYRRTNEQFWEQDVHELKK